MNNILRVALIGFGAVGVQVYRILGAESSVVNVVGTLALPDAETASSEGPPRFGTLSELLASKPDIVVECAGHQAVDAYGAQVLDSGHDLLVVSVGSLADALRHDRLVTAAARSGRQLVLPAGAVGGIDIVAAARLAGLTRVRLRSRKPPAAWLGTPAEHSTDLGALRLPTVVFRGSAREAAQSFPKNANVAATVALAGVGFDETIVELIADPATTNNTHEIEADGTCGRVFVRIEGAPSADNPKTSMVTAYSVARAVLARRASVVI